ncbi:MAG: 2-C-methyl-D-erythritol 4-phosphate cytidylyltransferase, partial [Gammaproteobacteria bacterium]
MGAGVPKQYLPLDGDPMIRHAARALLAAPWIEHLLVVVAPDDERAAAALAGLPRTSILAAAGATRRDTVLAGLRALGHGLESLTRANV